MKPVALLNSLSAHGAITRRGPQEWKEGIAALDAERAEVLDTIEALL